MLVDTLLRNGNQQISECVSLVSIVIFIHDGSIRSFLQKVLHLLFAQLKGLQKDTPTQSSSHESHVTCTHPIAGGGLLHGLEDSLVQTQLQTGPANNNNKL